MMYKIVCEDKPETLEEKINEWLDLGWEISGGHQMAKDAEGYKHFSQALTFDVSKNHPTQNHF